MKLGRGAAIVPYDGKIVFIKRTKYKEKISEDPKDIKEIYYVIPGGQQEEGETIEETTIREIKEEISLEIELGKLFYTEEYQGQTKYYFLTKDIKGELKEGIGPEFNQTPEDRLKYGKFEIVLLNKKDIKEYNIKPDIIKEILIESYEIIVKK